MKHLKCIIILLILASVDVNAQMLQYKLAQFGLKGKVQSVTERTGKCSEKFGEYVFADDDCSYEILFFNQSGKLTAKKTQRSSERRGMNVEKYSYVADGYTVSYYDPDGSLSGSFSDKFAPIDASNKNYTFYDNGAVKTESFIGEFGGVYEKYTYNMRGQITERRKYKEGVPKDIFAYTFDGNGNLKSMTRTRAGGVVAGKITYKYLKFDSHGNWTKRVGFEQQGETGNNVAETITTRLIEYY